MNGLPYYPRFPRDFIEGTVGMSFEEKGAYSIVLDLIYMQGGKLPDDPRYISGLLGVSVRKWRSLRAALIERGKISTDGEFISNSRADYLLENQRKYQDKQAENARTPRKNKGLEKPARSHTDTEKEKKKDTPPTPPAGGKRDTGSRLPDDWRLPQAWGAWSMSELGMSEDAVRIEAAKFTDHWHAAVGAKARKADWLATWRNWCRNALTRHPARAKDRRNMSVVEDLDQRGFRDLENDQRAADRRGDNRAPAARQPEDDVPRMLAAPEEENGPVPERDLRAGPHPVSLLALSEYGRSVA